MTKFKIIILSCLLLTSYGAFAIIVEVQNAFYADESNTLDRAHGARLDKYNGTSNTDTQLLGYDLDY